ncbi:lipopolysaccharide biosynthesis protein [Myxosarcina sp. GI1]|uniref:lipopolysaccharide biosynthesis protein n=1 Tax=Myxosarcina sp. GI1 TaxID=1541065 RepID=UPI000AFCCC40|nr:lipopolysaccharide biosynthesis protein [Myxosarcina sp. GI1]
MKSNIFRGFRSRLREYRLKKTNSTFTRNLGWLGLSGAVIRVTRLLTTIVLARFLTQHDYGLVAIVLTTNDIVRVFTRNGIGTRLIQAKAENVSQLAQSAYWLNWVIAIALFVIQCIAAFPLAWFYRDEQLILPICAMAFSLLLIPHGLVQAALIQRENRLKAIALVEMVQFSTDNVLSLIFAIAGLGMWAIILPKLLVPPIWVYIMLKNHSWRPKLKFTTVGWGDLLRFGRNVLGVELLNNLRGNLDYLIVGRFLSIDALGVYYFAFNAGLGISLGIITSIKAALLPHLCDARANIVQFKQRYFGSMKTVALIIVPMVLLQSSLAPIYVPLVFGEKWISAIPVLILVCLSAIPRPFADSASQLLIAVDKPQIDLYWNVIFTTLFSLSLLIGVYWQSIGVAATVLLVHAVCLPLFTIWATRYVFKRLSKT